MKKLLIVVCLIFFTAVPVSAAAYTAPEAPNEVQELLPEDRDSFGEGLWYVIRSAFRQLSPQIAQSCGICFSLMGTVMLTSVLGAYDGKSKAVVELVSVIAVACLLLKPANALIRLGTQTVRELSEYGKLLLPVMTAALAAQGGTTTSAALYTATAVFDAVLSSAISHLLVPLIYIYLVLSVVNASTSDTLMSRMRDFVKWLMSWGLKIVLYVFTGYIGVTGVVSGSVDQAALKAAKMTISGMVPVVGGMISDASESILVGASVMKNAAGVYGMLAMIAIVIGPFLRIGLQYLLLKLTAAVCDMFCDKKTGTLIGDFSGAMGLLLAMTGTVCLMLLISVVCFLKGLG